MRLIDADKMLSELKPTTYEMARTAVTIADMSRIMRNWVCRQPTASVCAAEASKGVKRFRVVAVDEAKEADA